jgi:hypothetical protein
MIDVGSSSIHLEVEDFGPTYVSDKGGEGLDICKQFIYDNISKVVEKSRGPLKGEEGIVKRRRHKPNCFKLILEGMKFILG